MKDARGGDEARAERAGRSEDAGGARSPSRWSERVPLALAAAVGCAVASYLAFVQVGRVDRPWDPVFGPASSLRVLHSAFSRALPFPDAAAGALAYAAEIVTLLAGGRARFRTHPWTVLACGALAAALGAGSVLLVFLQAAVIRSGCALCLVSAAISICVALVVRGEVAAAWHEVRGRRAAAGAARG